MRLLVRRLTRPLVLVLSTVALVAVTAVPAQAATCTLDQDFPDLPPITFPCPGYNDQPEAGATYVWVTTDWGPGYGNAWWCWIRVTQGATINFANLLSDDSSMLRMHGDGFDSGMVAYGEIANVEGIPQLQIGHYVIYNQNNAQVGDLFIDKPYIEPDDD